MKKIVILASALLIVGCSSNKQSSNTDTPVQSSGKTIEISNLAVGPDISVSPDSLALGAASPASPTLAQSVIIQNSGVSALPLAVSIPAPANGFLVKLSHCPATLPAKASCEVVIQFSARGLYNGSNASALSVVSGANSTSLNLTATITGQANPATSGTAILTMSLDAPFIPLNGSAVRTLTITNTGTGTATSIVPTLGSEYVLWVNHCGSTLAPNQSCNVQISYAGFRAGTSPTISGALSVTSNIATVVYDLRTNAVTITAPYTLMAQSPGYSISNSNMSLSKIDANNYLFSNLTSGSYYTIKVNLAGSDTIISSTKAIGTSSAYYPSTILGGKIYLNGVDSAATSLGSQPYTFDIASNTLAPLKTLNAGAQPHVYVPYLGNIYFTYITATSTVGLIKTDGTTANTNDFVAAGTAGGVYSDGNILIYSNAGSVFATNNGVTVSTAGAMAAYGVGGSPFVGKLGSNYYYISGNVLYKYDGSTITVASDLRSSGSHYFTTLVQANSIVYIMAQNNANSTTELYKVDGTGTVSLVKAGFTNDPGAGIYFKINQTSTLTNGQAFATVGDKLYFGAYVSSIYQLWTSDGTTGGTYSISPAGNAYSIPLAFYKTSLGTLIMKSYFWGAASPCNSIFKITGDTIAQITAFPAGVNDSSCSAPVNFYTYGDNTWTMNINNGLYRVNY